MFRKTVAKAIKWALRVDKDISLTMTASQVQVEHSELLQGLQGGIFVYKIANGFLMRDINPKGDFGQTYEPILTYASDEVAIAHAIIAHQAKLKLAPEQGELFGAKLETTPKPAPYISTHTTA